MNCEVSRIRMMTRTPTVILFILKTIPVEKSFRNNLDKKFKLSIASENVITSEIQMKKSYFEFGF